MNTNLQIKKKHVFVIGDILLDEYVMGEVTRLSPEAPVPIVRIKSKSNTLGGAGNVALNLAGLGCKVSIFGFRGNDIAGEKISEILHANGVCDYLVIDPLKPTTRKTRIIGHGQQLLRLDEEDIWEISKKYSDDLFIQIKSKIDSADVVILSDYSKGVLVGGLSQQIIKLCKKEKTPVFVDPKRKNWERYEGATCITPNISEFQEITNLDVDKDEKLMVNTAHLFCRKYSLEWIVVTRGAEGMCLIGKNDDPIFIKATALEVFDVSGAGDTVIAALSACFVSGMSLAESVEVANIAAGIVVGKLGSQPITFEELAAEFQLKKSNLKNNGNGKRLSLKAAEIKVKFWQANGEKIIFIDYCFSALNSEYIQRLQEAKKKDNRLVVGYKKNNSVKLSKNLNNGILTDKDNIIILSALSCVDIIIPYSGTLLNLIKVLKPNIIVKKLNHFNEVNELEFVKSYGGTFEIIKSKKNC